MALLFEAPPGDSVVFPGSRQAKPSVRREMATASARRASKNPAARPKGGTLPSLFPDRRWLGVHVTVAKGGDRRAVILSTIAANSLRGIATSAIRNATYRPWLTTFAPILTSFSRSVVSDHSAIASGIARVRRKLPRLYASA